MGIEVWKGQARWKILCLYIQQPKYFFCDSQFLFHVYEDGDIKRLKGKGEGKFLTDRLIGFFKPSKDKTIIYTWYPKEKTFSFDVTGIKGKGYLLLKLFPSKLDAPLFPCEEWFTEFLEIKDLKHAETIHVKALWDGIVMATAPDFQGIRIEAKEGATRKIQYRDEGMLLVEANIKIEKEECITVIDSIYGDITANGKKIDNPYLSGKTRIKTGKGASIRLNLPDGSTMKIGSDTEFEFNAECSGKKPQQIAASEYVKVFLGKMWIIISRPRPKSFLTSKPQLVQWALGELNFLLR